jgi:hypothetical protein
MLDVAAARRWWRDHLEPDESVHVADEAVLTRAAALLASTTVDTPDDREGP